jgi:hypothetical protein
MEIHPVVLISSIVVPVSIVTGIIIWVSVMQRKNIKNKHELLRHKLVARQKESENKLWEKLVSHKERHIAVLKKKLDKE